MYTIIKRKYDSGVWTAEQVALFVVAGVITPEQYTPITGLPYDGD